MTEINYPLISFLNRKSHFGVQSKIKRDIYIYSGNNNEMK